MFILKNKSSVPTPDTGYTGVYTNAGDLFIKDETGTVTQITSGGTVTSVDVTSSTLSVSGGPITSAGSITIDADIDTLVPSQTGNSGKVLSTDGTSVSWVTPASAGTVTSVGISGTNGISVSGSPITSSGVIDLSLTDIDVTNLTVYADSSHLNTNYLRLDSTSTGAELISSKVGTGVTKPFVFKLDSTEVGRISTAGQWILGTGTGSGLIPGSNLEIRNTDTNSSTLGALSHTSTTNGSSNLVLARARGVTGTPSAVLTGDRLGGIFFKGYGTSYDNNAAYIAAYAAQDWSGTERGGKLGFGVTTFGGTTTAELFTLNSAGPHKLIGALEVTDTLQVHSGMNTGTEGTLSWNDGDGTLDLVLKGEQVTLQLGQEQVIRINNVTGANLTAGQVVIVMSLQAVALADNSTEGNSSGIIGVVTESIAIGADGFVTTSGLVRNLDTSAFYDGATLYIGTGGGLTQTKPVSPYHMVIVGYCVQSHASSGSIFVKVQNGYELSELHDVQLDTLIDGQVLGYYMGAWYNMTLPPELPDHSGHADKVLGTDGNSVFWVYPPTELPDQYGHADKVLGTDGTSVYWVSPPASGVTSVGIDSGNAALTVTNSPVTSSGNITVTANTFTSSNPGVVPASGGGTSNYLRADGTWAAPAGGGGGSVYYKDPVKVGTTANITLSGAQTIDGVTVTTNDRVLVKNQATASQNGVYVASASAWARAADFDTSGAEVSNGCIIPVQFGTVNGGSVWQLTQQGGTIGNSFVFSPIGGVAIAGRSGNPGPTMPTNAYAVAIGRGASSGGSGAAIGGGCTTGWGALAAGSFCSAAGQYSAAMGDGASSSAQGSYAIGYQVTAGFNSSVVIGFAGANTEMVGEVTFSRGRSSAANDRKQSLLMLSTQTTNSTSTEMGLASGYNEATPTNRIVLSNDSSYIFDCDIIARSTTADDETAAFNLKFCIRRGTNAASTTLLGTPVASVIAADTGAATWTCAVAADTTNGRPNITVTGETSKTIRWVASVIMTKVTG